MILSLVFILLSISCEPLPLERRPAVRRCVIEVRYEPSHFPSALEVEVEGEHAPLTLLDAQRGEAGLWGADLWVTPGWRSYTLRVDGRILPDPKVPLTIVKEVQGREQTRSLKLVPQCDQGRWFRTASRQHQGMMSLDLAYERAMTSEERIEHPPPDLLEGVPLDPNTLEVSVDDQPYHFERQEELITIESRDLTNGKHWLTITGRDQRGEPFERFRAPFWVEPQPHRWERGLMYQVVLDRLSPPRPAEGLTAPTIGERWGGQLDSVEELLTSGYLSDLGVTSIWLSPLAPNPRGLWRGVEGGEPRYEGYHGYWSAAPRVVGDEWGGEALLERVVALAHERGMRVIVDVALNHVHEEHPYVTEHPDWFNPPGCLCGQPRCDWGTFIETCRFTPYLPDLRWRDLEAMKVQVDDALWWIERFNLDGLRVDAVPMMPRRVTRLLSAELKRRFEGLRTRHLLLGETFTGPREWERIGWYLGPEGLDGQFDFPWMWALREVIAWDQAPMDLLRDFWRIGEDTWGSSGSVMGLFVGNHDVTRFVSEAMTGFHELGRALLADPWLQPPPQTSDPRALDRLWIATALTLTLPGLPVLYYGDEVGLAGANDPDNRRPFWPLTTDHPSQLSDERMKHYKRVAHLGKLRSCLSALSFHEPQVRFLASDEEQLSFLRGPRGREVVVVIHRGASPQRILALPLADSGSDEWVDVMKGEVIASPTHITSQITRLTLPSQPAYSVELIIRRSQYTQCINIKHE